MTKLEGRYGSHIAGVAIEPGLRVKLVAGELQLAGSTDVELGIATTRAYAQGDVVNVDYRTAEGTQEFIASEAITAPNPFYAAASGKVAASGTILCGDAIESAAADGDLFEGIRRGESSVQAAAGGTTAAAFLVDSDATIPKIELGSQTGGTGDFKVTIKPPATITGNRVHTLPADSDQTLVGATAAQTLTNKTLTSPVITNGVTVDIDALTVTAAMSGQTITNEGAVAAGAKALPAAVVGLNYRFRVMANQELRIDPNGSETIALPSTGAQSATGKYITADAIGEFVEIECVKTGQWEVGSFRGTWTAEP